MTSLSELWHGGFRALHIEECIGNAFADFAPYAGADQQRLVVTRQSSSSPVGGREGEAVGTPLGPASCTPSTASVTVEENGDFTVQSREANAGDLSFSTTGQMQLETALRFSLPPRFTNAAAAVDEGSTAPSLTGSQRRENRSGAVQAADAATDTKAVPHDVVVIHPVSKPSPSQRRFSDFTRPVAPFAAPSPAYVSKTSYARNKTASAESKETEQAQRTEAGRAVSALSSPFPRSLAPSFGQLELDLTLPDWDANRQSVGVRAGPAALRLTRTFSSAATATTTDSQLRDGDDETAAQTNKSASLRRYQHNMDVAVCIPLGTSKDYDEGTGATTMTRTLDGKQITLRTAPWALACGLQFPLGIGDTLVGITLQSDRATSIALPYPGVEWAVTADATNQETSSSEASCVACVPSAFRPSASLIAAAGATDALKNPANSGATPVSQEGQPPSPPYFVMPSVSFRLLLVQTLASHTLVHDDANASALSQLDNSGSTLFNPSSTTRVASSYDWRRLPTLLSVNVGFDRERLRLSAASILHDEDMDLELAAVLDMTPWMPRMPTLLKLGYNNAGRLAAGITSLFYETITATLGVHMVRGAETKFGIEVKF